MTSQTSKYASGSRVPGAAIGARGRNATSPTQIPAKGWWDIAKRVFAELSNDRVMLIAAGVTYYMLLALVPALSALVSIFGLFADPVTVAEQVQTLKGVIPGGGVEILNEQLARLTEQEKTTLGLTFMISIGFALWSTNAGMKALFEAMNVAYDEDETRSFVMLTAVSLGFTVLYILSAVLLVGSTIILPTFLSFVSFGADLEWMIQAVTYLLVGAFALGALCLLYRYGPSRDPAKWRWITPGAIVSAVLIAVASVGFSFYVSNFGSYNATYGSLGALIGFLTWVWISMTILIMGAELNAEMEHQTRRDTTKGAREPMGVRDAYVADNVARPIAENGSSSERDGSSRKGQARPNKPMSLEKLAVAVPLAIVVGLLARKD